MNFHSVVMTPAEFFGLYWGDFLLGMVAGWVAKIRHAAVPTENVTVEVDMSRFVQQNETVPVYQPGHRNIAEANARQDADTRRVRPIARKP